MAYIDAAACTIPVRDGVDRQDAKNWEVCVGTLEALSEDIAENWIKLVKIVDRHYDKIWREWKSLSVDERKERLYKANDLISSLPLPTNRRPDINGLESRDAEKPAGYEDLNPWVPICAQMWPYLSEEDLAWGDAILVFLYHRAKTNWTEYQHGDLQGTRAGKQHVMFRGFRDAKAQLFTKPTKATKCVVRFEKSEFKELDRLFVRHSNERVGRTPIYYTFVPNEDGGQPKGRDTLDKFSVEDAMRVLRIQKRIYRVLPYICVTILKGLPDYAALEENNSDGCEWSDNAFADLLDTQQYPVRDTQAPEDRDDGFLYRGDEEIRPLLADVRVQTIYGPPSEIQWDVLSGLINDKVFETCITLTRLFQNPDFFKRSVCRERFERCEDGSVTLTSDWDFGNPQHTQGWLAAIKFCVSTAIKELDWWCGLQEAFVNLYDVYSHQSERLATKDDSSEFWHAAKEFDRAAYRFWYPAWEYSEKLVQELHHAVSRSPLVAGYIQEAPLSGKLVFNEKFEKDHTVANASRKEVYKKLLRLLADSKDRYQFGLSALLDDLQRTIHGSAWQWDRQNALVEQEDQDDATNQNNAQQTAGGGGGTQAQGSAPGQSHGIKDQERARLKKEKKKAYANRMKRMAYLPNHVHRMLGDLEIFAEYMNQVERFQPFGTLLFSNHELGLPPKLQVRNSWKGLQRILKQLTSSDRPWQSILSYALPIEERFDYPDDDELTPETFEKQRATENNLDIFWDMFQDEFGPNKQKALSERALEFFRTTPKRAFWQDPDAVPQIEGQQKEQEIAPAEEPSEEKPPAW